MMTPAVEGLGRRPRRNVRYSITSHEVSTRKPPRLFHRTQVELLQILYERCYFRVLVVLDGKNGRPAVQLCSMPASLSGKKHS